MKHLKKFNESLVSKRLSVEDIEDYFLEFIDNESITFSRNVITRNDNLNTGIIETIFVLNNKLCRIDNIEEMTNLANLINKIRDVIKRWNLDFKFSTIAIDRGGNGMQTQISIHQPIPKVVMDNFYTQGTSTPSGRIILGESEVKYHKFIQVDDNSDFIINIIVTGGGRDGKWSKSDYDNFSQKESEFIKNFTDNKDVPSEFIRKQKTSDLKYGKPFYNSFYFKLLV